MPEIAQALCTLSLDAAGLDRLRQAIAPGRLVAVNRLNRPGIAAAMRDADVAFLHGDLDSLILAGRTLRWVHCAHAGLERSARPEVFARGLLLTSAAGRSAPALAEHVMFFLLALSIDYPRFYAAQQARRWGAAGQRKLRALHGATLGLVGLGHIGSEVARRAQAFGMRVVAYRRRFAPCPEVERLYCAERGEDLDALLRESDFVVLAAALNDRTRHMIGARELSLMKRSAFLVNIARGGLVDEAALISTLQDGRIAGAAIDVAETEPLPAASPLWSAPNLLITPHATPQLRDAATRSLDILCENIRRYRAGEPLLNRLTSEDIFTPAPRPAGLPGALHGGGRFLRRLAHRLRTR